MGKKITVTLELEENGTGIYLALDGIDEKYNNTRAAELPMFELIGYKIFEQATQILKLCSINPETSHVN